MLTALAWGSIALALFCAFVIAVDELRHPQKMAIMNVVWPATALYFSVFALWAYVVKGRRMTRDAAAPMPHQHMEGKQGQQQASPHPRPSLVQTALATSHCGAGCALADVITEFTVFASGALLLGSELYASYLWDFLAAWLLGIVFQYFSIKPMRQLNARQAIWAAVKADTLSILAFQIGMYGWMALVYFRLFPAPHLIPTHPTYWLMMQIAMICGYVTSLPVNWLLIRLGWKEVMG